MSGAAWLSSERPCFLSRSQRTRRTFTGSASGHHATNIVSRSPPRTLFCLRRRSVAGVGAAYAKLEVLLWGDCHSGRGLLLLWQATRGVELNFWLRRGRRPTLQPAVAATRSCHILGFKTHAFPQLRRLDNEAPAGRFMRVMTFA